MTEKKNETPETPETPEAQPTPAAAPTGPSQAQQASAAASAAISDVRAKLVAGEQFMLSAAGGIVLIYLIWQFLLDYRIFIDNFPVIIAVLTVLTIWIHRWGHYDFGKAYRIVLGALGVSLALFALMSLLGWARVGGNSEDFFHLLGRLLYWAAGVAAFVGAWQVFRTRED
jgi:hypothetical protein